MNAAQIMELQHIIDQNIKRLEAEQAALQDACQPIAPDCSLGDLGRMEQIQDQKVSQEILIQTQRHLQRLYLAQERLHSDTYGKCTECDDEIPFERLKLVPESTICMECANDPS